MHAFEPSLDDDFVMVDGDVSYGEVRDLVGDMSPGHIVIRDADEDDEQFYILETDSLCHEVLRATGRRRTGL